MRLRNFKRRDFTMRQKKSLVLMARGFLLLLLLPALAFANLEGKTEMDKDALMKKVSGLQMPFIENQGQIKDKSVRFYANTFAGTVFITDKGEIVYSLVKTEAGTENTEHRQEKSEDRIQNAEDRQTNTKAVVLRETLECPEETGIRGVNKSVTMVNYFIGSKDNWRTNIPTWQEVSLGEVYEGIELKLKAYGNNVEKLFTVYPGGTSEDIKLKMEGAKGIKVNKSGELEIETALGTVKMTKPVAYQETGGEKKYIQVAYNVLAGSGTYGFEIGEYDQTKPLVIDPLLASTFIGGGSGDYAKSLAVDSSGDVFVAGYTGSPDYPTTESAYDTTLDANADVFISKFDSNLSILVSSTFIGGSGSDHFYALAVDSSGDVFVAGGTHSYDYPTTVGAYDTVNSGKGDVFVSKLDSDLSILVSSTFIGGSTYDSAYTLAIDSAGDVFVAGETDSTDYPTTEGAYDTSKNGSFYSDVFVSKLDSNLSSLVASTFIGEGRYDSSVHDDLALAVDSSGGVFVAGGTGSSDYPTTVGAYDTVYNGKSDVFVSKLDGDLSSLVLSTFIGGSDFDDAFALTIDSSGDVFVAGQTYSSDYPTTEGAYDTSKNGNGDVFVSKLDSDLSSLLASTFIGGSYSDYVDALAIDSSGDVFVAGDTWSYDYPTTEGAYDTTYNDTTVGDYDVFVSKLDNNLSSLLASTFIGGSYSDYAETLAIDFSGNVFIAGYTYSSDYPITEGAYDTTDNGYYDVFVSKLDSDLSAGVTDISVSPASHDFGRVPKETTSPPAIFTISNTGGEDLVIGGVYLTGPNPYQFRIRNDNCSGQTLASSGSCTIEAVYRPTKTGTMYAEIGIGSNDPDTPTLYIELTGTGVKEHEDHEEH
ncbi:MAG TPA: choice-of-anchor D domain-containing protein [Nitrospirae bacterium]|nr:beta-propeller repeat protein [bacterium BMS3Abin06]HDH12937.1 choice-of-anchor D domain-containing protein [Nitrospirota bacterium]HDL19862.1 choice-of-anchor D domain-containing protein [Nitrospirota bacterium]HDZ01651.1 choice-of-anchor D domain-containing protein [Nitrospirota bacterium]